MGMALNTFPHLEFAKQQDSDAVLAGFSASANLTMTSSEKRRVTGGNPPEWMSG